MYKIFIVEDELLIRESIRNLVLNLNGPYALCGEAADGEIALSMMQDLMPDILLTDIKMPFLDGFGLIRHVKLMIPWIKIIILSGYDAFESAQKAISLGVDSYLLKPIRQDELLAAINKAADDLDARKENNSGDAGLDKDELQHALHQHFMQQLLYGGADTAHLLERARTLELEIVHPFYQVLLISFDMEADNRERLRDRIFTLLKNQEIKLYSYNQTDQLSVVLCADDPSAQSETTYRFIQIARHEFEDLGVLTIVVGNIVDRLSGIQDACIAADAMMKKARSLCAGEVLDVNDTAQITARLGSFSGLFDGEDFQQRLQNLKEEDIEPLLDLYLHGENSDKFESLLYRYYALADILKAAVQMVALSNLNTDRKDIAARISSNHNILLASERRESFVSEARSLLLTALRLRDENSGVPRHGHVIGRAKAYIEEHFCDPNISLLTTAKEVGMSPAHFSTIFAQTVGTNFINYLTAMRIAKAKELLRATDQKLGAIAMDIGYNEPNYFSHVFKKTEGISPKEYRAQYQKP
ncbi:MAG: helix-turn-helix domain-containing protein [Clostridium sp.]|jgi:two-component system response regulator YesN|nr:helix-turn-helix domain-containing protein [Clostridium sp.]